MNRTIAVEDGLTPVKEFLQEKGYQVVSIRQGKNADAAIITGMDDNMMNMQDIVVDAPVVNAQGMTPQEVLHALESKWRH